MRKNVDSMEECVNHFQTFGFLMCNGLLSTKELEVLSQTFDEAMSTARHGTVQPELRRADRGYSAVRQQVNSDIPPFVAFFDYAPAVFNPLLADERIVSIFRNLMDDDFEITVT